MKLKDFDFRIWDNDSESFVETNIRGTNLRIIPADDDYNMELELWTGLVDVNGKKIYEGDIIKYVYVFKHSLLNQDTIKKLPKKVSIGYIGIDNFLGFRVLKNKELQCFMQDSENIEVIGNIHENADLLE